MKYKKKCKVCGVDFLGNSRASKYCADCSSKIKKEKKSLSDNKRYYDNKSCKIGRQNKRKDKWGLKLIECIKKNEFEDFEKNGCLRLKAIFNGETIIALLPCEINELLYKRLSFFLKEEIITATFSGTFIDISR